MSRARGPRREPSIEGLIGAVIGLTIAYIGAEAFLPGPLHPIHWAIAVLGGGVGFLLGQAVHRYQAGHETPFPRRDGRTTRAVRKGVPPRR